MKSIIKIIWLISIVAVSLSMIWFLIGSTACFQRNIDLVRTVVLLLVWIPAFAFVGLSILALKKGWLPSNTIAKISLIIIIIVFSLIFIITLIRHTSTYGWLKESVTKDYLQTTIDKKYEYRLELVNMFQRNSYARIYIKDIVTSEETKILLDIPTKQKTVILGGEGYVSTRPDDSLVWSKLMPSGTESIYVLTTTELFDEDNTYCFRIDMESKTAHIEPFGDVHF